MGISAVDIRIPELTHLDELELSKRLPADGLRFEQATKSPDLHGELATVTAVVIVSLAALKVLAAYLAKKHYGGTVKQTVEVTTRDGTRRRSTIECSATSEEPPDAAVLKQLAELCDVDLTQAAGL